MAQTVHLGTKYESKIQQQFTAGSLLQGRLENTLDFVGAKTVRIHTINTVPLGDYNREASQNRYGVPEEVGDSVQELAMTQDKAFAGIIDRGNSLDQSINKAGEFVRVQVEEAVIPMKDRYAFGVLAQKAGIIVNGPAIDKDNVLTRMGAARSWFLNHRVPRKGRTWYVTTAVYDALVGTEQFKNIDSVGGKALVTGQVGTLFGSPVVEAPEDLLPAGVNFIFMHKSAAASPTKIADTKIHIDPPGISGNLVEGRYYWDTFVFGAKAAGIFTDITKANGVSQLAMPQINASTGAIGGVNAPAVCMYTTDGSDPRYSQSAKQGTAPALLPGMTLRAYQYHPADPKVFPSAVARAGTAAG